MDSDYNDASSFNPLRNLQQNWTMMQKEAGDLREFVGKNSFFDKSSFTSHWQYIKEQSQASIDYYKEHVWDQMKVRHYQI